MAYHENSNLMAKMKRGVAAKKRNGVSIGSGENRRQQW
jgi:hypothetical protein